VVPQHPQPAVRAPGPLRQAPWYALLLQMCHSLSCDIGHYLAVQPVQPLLYVSC